MFFTVFPWPNFCQLFSVFRTVILGLSTVWAQRNHIATVLGDHRKRKNGEKLWVRDTRWSCERCVTTFWQFAGLLSLPSVKRSSCAARVLSWWVTWQELCCSMAACMGAPCALQIHPYHPPVPGVSTNAGDEGVVLLFWSLQFVSKPSQSSLWNEKF